MPNVKLKMENVKLWCALPHSPFSIFNLVRVAADLLRVVRLGTCDMNARYDHSAKDERASKRHCCNALHAARKGLHSSRSTVGNGNRSYTCCADIGRVDTNRLEILNHLTGFDLFIPQVFQPHDDMPAFGQRRDDTHLSKSYVKSDSA